MDINQLKIFHAVATYGSFSKAAEKLFLAQPTITKNIQALEENIGVLLIERSSRRFNLTEDGIRFKALAEDLLSKWDDMLLEMNDIRTLNSGSVTIAGPPISIAFYFPKLIKLVRDNYPGININVIECGSKTSVEMVCDGLADIGISQLPVLCPDIDIHPIIQDRCVLLVNEEHPLASKERVSIHELVNEKFISLPSGFVMHDTVQDICRRAGFTPNIVFNTTLVSFAEKLVSLNEGISILPRPLVGVYPSPGVKMVELEECIPWDVALIISNKRYRTAAAIRTLKLAIRHFEDSERD